MSKNYSFKKYNQFLYFKNTSTQINSFLKKYISHTICLAFTLAELWCSHIYELPSYVSVILLPLPL